MVLMGGAPPLDPPLPFLVANPVPTDPRRKVFAYEEERDDWVLRLVWDQDDPGLLSAEYRAPLYGRRLEAPEVRKFWQVVKEKVESLGPLRVESADPRPS